MFMDLVTKYNNDGYFLLKNIYTNQEVDKIKKLVNELDVNKFEHSKDKTGYPFRITNILPKHSELKKIVEKPEVLSILKKCMGDEIIFFKDKYISKKKNTYERES